MVLDTYQNLKSLIKFKKLTTTIYGIPIHCVSYTHPIFSDYFISESYIKIKKDTDFEYFCGFSCSKKVKNAIVSSRYESLERILSSRTMITSQKLNSGFELISLNNISTGRIITKDKVLIRESDSVGATGIALHYDMDKALQHGILEVIERHILYDIWYGNREICKLEQNEFDKGNLVLEIFSTNDSIPFCLCILTNKERKMIFSGSALRCSFLDSKEHAISEAVGLSTNYFVKRFPPAPKYKVGRVETINNISRLIGEEANVMYKHLIRNLKCDPVSKMKANTYMDILSYMNIGFDDINYVNINKYYELLVLRVFIKNLKNKEIGRSEKNSIILDPFC